MSASNSCPSCGNRMLKVIFAGFPMRLCPNANCCRVAGVWSWVPGNLVPFDGFFMAYEGSYLPALWHWLTGDVQ